MLSSEERNRGLGLEKVDEPLLEPVGREGLQQRVERLRLRRDLSPLPLRAEIWNLTNSEPFFGSFPMLANTLKTYTKTKPVKIS